MSAAEIVYDGYEEILEPTEEELKYERHRAARLIAANVARRIGQGVCVLGAAAFTATAVAAPEPISKAIGYGMATAFGKGVLKLEHGFRRAEVQLGKRDSTDNRLVSTIFRNNYCLRDKLQEFSRTVSKVASVALTVTAFANPATAPVALGIAAASAVNAYRLNKQIDERVERPKRSDYSPAIGRSKQDLRWEKAMAKSQEKYKTVKRFDDAATRQEKFNRFCEQGSAVLARSALDKMAKMGLVDSKTMISLLTSSAPLEQSLSEIAANVTEDKLPKLQKLQQWYAKKDANFARQIAKMVNVEDMQNAQALNMRGFIDSLAQRNFNAPANVIPLPPAENMAEKAKTTEAPIRTEEPAKETVQSELAKENPSNPENVIEPKNATVDAIPFNRNGIRNLAEQSNGLFKMQYEPINDTERIAIIERLKSVNPDLPKSIDCNVFKGEIPNAKIEIYQDKNATMVMAKVYFNNAKDMDLPLNAAETTALKGAISEKLSEKTTQKNKEADKGRGND